MREEIYRFLSPPERGTPRYRAITAAKEICNLLFMTLAILVIARACGNFNASPGSTGNHVLLALWAVVFARFAAEPVVWILKKLVGIGRKEEQGS